MKLIFNKYLKKILQIIFQKSKWYYLFVQSWQKFYKYEILNKYQSNAKKVWNQ